MITSTCKANTLLPATTTPTLTTIFTPPAFCSTRFRAGDLAYSMMSGWGFGWHDQVDPQWYSCVPPEWDATACQELVFSITGKGGCPAGWTTQSVREEVAGSTVMMGTGTCCMSGFTANSLGGQGVVCGNALVSGGMPLVFLATDPVNRRFVSPVATDVSTTTMFTGMVLHRGLVVVWESSTEILPVVTTASPPTTGPAVTPSAASSAVSVTATSTMVPDGSLATADASTSTSTAGVPSPQVTGTEPSKRLPTPAIVGIVVLVVAGVALLITAAVLVVLNRRRARSVVGERGTMKVAQGQEGKPSGQLPLSSKKQAEGPQPAGLLRIGSRGFLKVVYEMPG